MQSRSENIDPDPDSDRTERAATPIVDLKPERVYEPGTHDHAVEAEGARAPDAHSDSSPAHDPGDADDQPEAIGRSSIGRNIAHLLFSQVTTALLGTFLIIAQSRYLGPEGVGLLRLVVSIWTIAQVVIGLGTSMFLTLSVARDRERGLALVGPVFVIRMIVFGITATFFAILTLASGASSEFALVMLLQGLSVLFSTFADALVAVFFGLERMSVPARANVATRLVATTVTVALLIAGGDVRSVVAVTLGANIVGLIIMAHAYRGVGSMRLRGWRTGSLAIVAGSLGFLFAQFIIVSYQQVDVIVISLLLERRVLGWYSTADAAFGSLLFLTTVPMSTLFPVIGRLYNEDRDEMRRLVGRAASTLLLIAVPLGLGLIVVADQLALLLFGPEFAESGDVLSVLGVVTILTFWTVLFGTVALATNRQRFWNLVMLTAIVATIPLDLLFVPWADTNHGNGAIGGAMAYVVTELFMVVIGLWKVVPYLLSPPFVWRSVRVLLAGMLMFAAAWSFRDEFVIIPIATGSIVYAVAVVAMGALTDDQRRIIGNMLTRVGLTTRWTTP